jgi:phenylacetic acid degradation protein
LAIYSFEGKIPVIHPKAYVHESAQIIGSVVIGEGCYVGAGAIIRGDYCDIKIGNRVAVEEGCILHAPTGETLTIGSDVILGHGALIHNTVIEDHVRIAIGVITGIWAYIEEWAVIGDGALVPPKQRVIGGKVYLGNPIKAVRAITDQDKKGTLEAVDIYTRLAERCHSGLQRLS